MAVLLLCAACGKKQVKKISDDSDESEEYEYVITKAAFDDALNSQAVDDFMNKLTVNSSAGDLATGSALIYSVIKENEIPMDVVAELAEKFTEFFKAGIDKNPETFERVFKHYLPSEDFSAVKNLVTNPQSLIYDYAAEEGYAEAVDSVTEEVLWADSVAVAY